MSKPWSAREEALLREAMEQGGRFVDIVARAHEAGVCRTKNSVLDKIRRIEGRTGAPRGRAEPDTRGKDYRSFFEPPVMRRCIHCKETRPMDKNHRICGACKAQYREIV